MITDKELDKIRMLCESATPGPWVSFIEGRDHASGSNFILTGQGSSFTNNIELIGGTPEDQDFIAHAREDVPRLLCEIVRLKKLISE